MDVKRIGLMPKKEYDADCLQILKQSAAVSSGYAQILVGLCTEQAVNVAETILSLKKEKPSILLECIMPYETVVIDWNEKLRNRFFLVMEQCDKETMLQTRYTTDYLERLEAYIRQYSDAVI